MKILKKILIFLGVLIALVLIVDIFLPGKVTVSRTRKMSISRETAFEKVSVLQNWPKWMTWAKLDTAAAYTYSGEPASGDGAWYTWKGNDDMGEGKMTILKTYGKDSIDMSVEFKGMGTNPVKFKFFEKDNGCEVYWAMDFEFPFVMRFMGLMIDGIMAADYEGGLEGIEKLGLNEPSKPAAAYQTVETKEMMCLTITDSSSVADMGKKYEQIYGAINAEIKAQNLEQAGAPFAINLRMNEAQDFFVFMAGIPISAEVKKAKNPKVVFNKMTPTKALYVEHWGSYYALNKTYETVYAYIAENKIEQAGNSWEEYTTDPMMEKDSTKWLTKIYIPIK